MKKSTLKAILYRNGNVRVKSNTAFATGVALIAVQFVHLVRLAGATESTAIEALNGAIATALKNDNIK